MKITSKAFAPVTVVIETADEARAMMKMLGRATRSDHARDAGFSVDADTARADTLDGAMFALYEALNSGLGE